MACWIMKCASTGSEQQTTRRPAVCAKYASLDSLWCSTAPMPPPTGMRTTTGSFTAPSERARILASCDTIWSNAGYTNPSNWISQTGRYPRSAMPIAVPMMPDSASGASMTRSSPKSFCRPSVTRKTPPSLPMSSPMMRTLGSASMAARRPVLMPLARLICAMSATTLRAVAGIGERLHVLGELRPLLLDQRVRVDVHVLEHVERLRVGHAQAALPDVRRQLVALGVQGGEEVVVGHAVRDEVGLEPADRVALLPHLDLGRHPVAGGVVGRRMGAHAVGEGLDERRPAALPRVVERGLGDGVHREDVVAVDPDAREAEARGALVQRDA